MPRTYRNRTAFWIHLGIVAFAAVGIAYSLATGLELSFVLAVPGLIVIGACTYCLLLARSRVVTDDEHIRVVNPVSGHRMGWREVAEIALVSRHGSWSAWLGTWDRRWIRIWGFNPVLIGAAGPGTPVATRDPEPPDGLRDAVEELRAELVSWRARQPGA